MGSSPPFRDPEFPATPFTTLLPFVPLSVIQVRKAGLLVAGVRREHREALPFSYRFKHKNLILFLLSFH